MAPQYDAWADVYDLEYWDITDDLDFYVSEARAARPPVLELACGTGRVTLPIAEAGVPIVGVDASARMLDRAREKATARGDLPVRWVQADMRDFRLDERFGLAIIPFRSFLHLLTPADQVQALETIRRHLLPGGRLAMNLFVPNMRLIVEHSATTRQMMRFRREFTTAGGERYVVWDSRRYDLYLQRIWNRMRFEQLDGEGNVVAVRYRDLELCWIWPREMEHLLARCGFRVEGLYGGLDRRPFDAESSEQVWMAVRD
jgi:SAM-dependent methyltransferase